MLRNERLIETRPDILGSLIGNELVISSARVDRAVELGRQIHAGQERHSGEPYFEDHCMRVAALIQGLVGLEHEDLVIGGLLHDTIEDHGDIISIEDLRREFGDEVAYLVDGVSKLSSPPEGGWRSRTEKDRAALKKVAIGVYADVGVPIIKLADRTHNLSTLRFVPEEGRSRKAEETIRAYGKLAGVLNCYEWKRWLEDMAFPFVDKTNFDWVKKAIDFDPRLSGDFVEPTRRQLQEIMEVAGIDGSVGVVLNGYYESWKKMGQLALLRLGSLRSFEAVNDVVSFRMIVDGGNDEKQIDECYRLFGKMQNVFGRFLLPDKFNDYISVPQTGYSALQSTIYVAGLGEVEIAIETREMNERNRWGAVYDLRNGNDLSAYKTITVITPSNSYRFLPDGSTVLDAVAAIQGNLLSEISSVLVNGKMVRLADRVRPGDMVEVVSDGPKMKPSEEWLVSANDSTRRALRSVIRREQIMEAVVEGRRRVAEVIAGRGIMDLEDIIELRQGSLSGVLSNLGCASLEDLYLGVGGNTVRRGELAKMLDEIGITKDKLGWVSIRITGKEEANVKGVMRKLSEVVTGFGGNILRLVQNTGSDKGFELRLVVENVGVGLEKEILSKYEELNLAIEVEVV